MKLKNFTEFLLQKFIEWEKTQPRRQSYSAYARYLGVRQTTFSQWINGNGVPSYENVVKLSEFLGQEIYEILGYTAPGEIEGISLLPPELQAAILATNKRIASLGTPVDFSTSLKILAEETKPFEVMATSNTDKDGSTK